MLCSLLWSWLLALAITPSARAEEGEEAVFTLTKDNFKDVLTEEKLPWLVEFYAPWCGHCKNLEPEWEKAAQELRGQVNFGKVDATIETELAAEYEVQSFPTIKIFYFGAVDDFHGPRKSQEIVKWCEDALHLGQPPVSAVELVSQAVFEENCESKTCVIAVLPHILDSRAEGRHAFINTLNQVYRRVRQDPWVVLWTHARAHAKFEDDFQIGGTGYPAVVAVSKKKQRYANMVTAFTSNNVVDFLVSIIKGQASTVPYSHEVVLETIEAWDGKDGEVFQEEEFDLSELGIDVGGDDADEATEHEEL